MNASTYIYNMIGLYVKLKVWNQNGGRGKYYMKCTACNSVIHKNNFCCSFRGPSSSFNNLKPTCKACCRNSDPPEAGCSGALIRQKPPRLTIKPKTNKLAVRIN